MDELLLIGVIVWNLKVTFIVELVLVGFNLIFYIWLDGGLLNSIFYWTSSFNIAAICIHSLFTTIFVGTFIGAEVAENGRKKFPYVQPKPFVRQSIEYWISKRIEVDAMEAHEIKSSRNFTIFAFQESEDDVWNPAQDKETR